MLLQDICKGTDVKTVHDVISVFRRDTNGTTSVLLGEVAKLMKLFMVLPSSSSSYFISKVRDKHHFIHNTSACAMSVPRGLPEKPQLIGAGRPLEKFNIFRHVQKKLRTTQKLD